MPLPDNVAIYIAGGRIKSNIRELEGSLIRLMAYASMTGARDHAVADAADAAQCARQRRSMQ